MPSMSAGDVISLLERLAHAYRNGLLARVEVCKARHLARKIELVRVPLKSTNAPHLTVHVEPARLVVTIYRRTDFAKRHFSPPCPSCQQQLRPASRVRRPLSRHHPR